MTQVLDEPEAPELDRRLRAARFQTLVHGDAKPANFCFDARRGAVAAVDFQYVGGGCGMKDVAYLLSGEREDKADAWVEALSADVVPEKHDTVRTVVHDAIKQRVPLLRQLQIVPD